MKATDQLLKDHRMIRKLLTIFSTEHPRFSHTLTTLNRIVVAHAWFEDTIFLPALKKEPRLSHILTREINQEHEDIETLIKAIHKNENTQEQDIFCMQLTSILSTHLEKEEEALFPLAERILDNEGLNQLGDEMERRKSEVRPDLDL